MYSILIKNGTVLDGTGQPGRRADVAIEGDRIVSIGENLGGGAHMVLDAENKIVTPGFIDAQNHSDSYWQLFDNPRLDSLLTQGYTSILVGHCGASLAPLLSPDSLLAMQKWHNLEGSNINWQSFAEFSEIMAERSFGCNVGSLVGYDTLRRGLIGDSARALENSEIASLKRILAESLAAGAFGLSSGLSYAHEIFTSQLELLELVKITAEQDGLFSIHIRNEGEEIAESLEEALELARRSGVRLKISHFKIRDRGQTGRAKELLQTLEQAWHKGLKVHYDSYPYDTTWQVLYSYFPKWAIAGGRQQLLAHLRNATQRKKILNYLASSQTNLAELFISSTAANLNVAGKTLGQVAKGLEITSEEAALRLIENGGSEILVMERNLDPRVVNQLLDFPLALVATDGGGFALQSRPKMLVHPRCFGTAPRYLRRILSEQPENLPEAIRKLTSAPAETAGFADRGQLDAGAYADVLIIDPSKLQDNATLANPFQHSSGLDYVLVNGKLTIAKGHLLNELGGRFLKKE